MQISRILIPITSCILITALVAEKTGFPLVAKVLIYFGIFVAFVSFFVAAHWVVNKNSAIYKHWRRTGSLEKAVTKVMKDTEIELQNRKDI